MIFCTQCGEILKARWVCCPGCGAKLPPFKKEPPKEFVGITIWHTPEVMLLKGLRIDGSDYTEEQVRAALKEFSEHHATGSGNIAWGCTAPEYATPALQVADMGNCKICGAMVRGERRLASGRHAYVCEDCIPKQGGYAVYMGAVPPPKRDWEKVLRGLRTRCEGRCYEDPLTCTGCPLDLMSGDCVGLMDVGVARHWTNGLIGRFAKALQKFEEGL